MLKAGALYIVIVIAVVISLISSSMLLIYYHNAIAIKHNQLIERLYLNVASATQLILATRENEPLQLLDLYGDNTDSVRLTYQQHGLFEVVSVQAFRQKDTATSVFMLGYRPGKELKSALYVTEGLSRLTLMGNTTITGDCYLPQGTVDIDGSVGNTSKIIGKIYKSKESPTKINTKAKKQLLDFFEALPLSSTSIDDFDSLKIPFSAPTYTLYSSNAIELNKKYWGNMVIKSRTLIKVGANARLEDVVLIAPSIIFEDGFVGTLQAFASDSIVIGRNCSLRYPSVVGLIRPKRSESSTAFVKMNENSKLSGYCFVDLSYYQGQIKSVLLLHQKSLIEGMAYVDGYAEISGSIHGHLSCYKTRVRNETMHNDNTLLNANINYTKLSTSYLGPVFINTENNEKGIVKYLK